MMAANWSLSNSTFFPQLVVGILIQKEFLLLSYLFIYSFIYISLCSYIFVLSYGLKSQTWNARAVTDLARGSFFNLVPISFRHVSIIFWNFFFLTKWSRLILYFFCLSSGTIYFSRSPIFVFNSLFFSRYFRLETMIQYPVGLLLLYYPYP